MKRKSSDLRQEKRNKMVLTCVFSVLAVVYLLPIFLVLVNSFKANAYVNTDTFALPNEESFVGMANYAKGMTFGIVVAEWNENITAALLEGAKSTLIKHGVDQDDINVMTVPGSFELIYGAAQMVKTDVDAVIAIGCVIRGDTPHDRYICQGVTAGLSQLNAQQDTPVIYGLITTLDMEQAQDRAGGKMGNKGDECAITAIKMVDFRRKIEG